MPRASRTAYLVREAAGWIAFVPLVGGGGYFKTHWCVLVVSCTYCKAKVGALCEGRDGPVASTHYDRRRDAFKVSRPEYRERLTRALPGVAFSLDMLEYVLNEEP